MLVPLKFYRNPCNLFEDITFNIEFSSHDGHWIRIYLARVVPTILFLKILDFLDEDL